MATQRKLGRAREDHLKGHRAAEDRGLDELRAVHDELDALRSENDLLRSGQDTAGPNRAARRQAAKQERRPGR